MAITDLIPWKKNESYLPVRRGWEGDPFLDLRSQVNRMFDEFFERPFGMSPFFSDANVLGEFTPRIDVNETEKEITVIAELPGMEPEDIEISLDRNALTIRGEKRSEDKEKGKRFMRVERSYGSFQRVINLPIEVDEDKVEASYKRGLLTITLPKSKSAREISKRIAIKAG